MRPTYSVMCGWPTADELDADLRHKKTSFLSALHDELVARKSDGNTPSSAAQRKVIAMLGRILEERSRV